MKLLLLVFMGFSLHIYGMTHEQLLTISRRYNHWKSLAGIIERHKHIIARYELHQHPQEKDIVIKQMERCLSHELPTHEPPLLTFATNDLHAPLLARMLALGCYVNQRGSQAQTALHNAINCDSLINLDLLLRYGANVNAQDINGDSPLIACIKRLHSCESELLYTRYHGIMRMLLAYGANPNASNMHGLTPLHELSCCFHRGHHPTWKNSLKERASILIDYGASIHIASSYPSCSPLQLASIRGHHELSEHMYHKSKERLNRFARILQHAPNTQFNRLPIDVAKHIGKFFFSGT